MNSQGREIREPDDRGIGYNRKTEETKNQRTKESESQRIGKPDNRKATEPESQNELLRVCKGGTEWQKKQRTLETGNTKVTYSQ